MISTYSLHIILAYTIFYQFTTESRTKRHPKGISLHSVDTLTCKKGLMSERNMKKANICIEWVTTRVTRYDPCTYQHLDHFRICNIPGSLPIQTKYKLCPSNTRVARYFKHVAMIFYYDAAFLCDLFRRILPLYVLIVSEISP